MVVRTLQGWFEIQNRSAIDGLEWAHLEAKTIYREQDHGMQANRIGTVRGASCEYPLEGSAQVVPRMHLQEIASRLVQPCQQEEAIIDGKPEACRRVTRIKLDPGRRRTFGTLLGCVLGTPER